MRYLITTLLFLQLIAAISAERPAEARHRSLGSASVVSHARLPEPRTEKLRANQVTSIYSANPSDQLKYALLSSGILLTARRAVMVDDRLSLNNPVVSKGHLISGCRAFLIGHLIKNAYTKTYRLQASGAR
jgi:hypothetical protein